MYTEQGQVHQSTSINGHINDLVQCMTLVDSSVTASAFNTLWLLKCVTQAEPLSNVLLPGSFPVWTETSEVSYECNFEA